MWDASLRAHARTYYGEGTASTCREIKLDDVRGKLCETQPQTGQCERKLTNEDLNSNELSNAGVGALLQFTREWASQSSLPPVRYRSRTAPTFLTIKPRPMMRMLKPKICRNLYRWVARCINPASSANAQRPEDGPEQVSGGRDELGKTCR